MGWTLEQDDFTNVMRHRQTEVWLDKDCQSLEVLAAEGSGYYRAAINTFIPMDLLVKMMEHAGYTVTK